MAVFTYNSVSYTHLTLPTRLGRRVDLGGRRVVNKKKKKKKRKTKQNGKRTEKKKKEKEKKRKTKI